MTVAKEELEKITSEMIEKIIQEFNKKGKLKNKKDIQLSLIIRRNGYITYVYSPPYCIDKIENIHTLSYYLPLISSEEIPFNIVKIFVYSQEKTDKVLRVDIYTTKKTTKYLQKIIEQILKDIRPALKVLEKEGIETVNSDIVHIDINRNGTLTLAVTNDNNTKVLLTYSMNIAELRKLVDNIYTLFSKAINDSKSDGNVIIEKVNTELTKSIDLTRKTKTNQILQLSSWYIMKEIFVNKNIRENVMKCIEELGEEGHIRIENNTILMDNYALETLRGIGAIVLVDKIEKQIAPIPIRDAVVKAIETSIERAKEEIRFKIISDILMLLKEKLEISKDNKISFDLFAGNCSGPRRLLLYKSPESQAVFITAKASNRIVRFRISLNNGNVIVTISALPVSTYQYEFRDVITEVTKHLSPYIEKIIGALESIGVLYNSIETITISSNENLVKICSSNSERCFIANNSNSLRYIYQNFIEPLYIITSTIANVAKIFQKSYQI